jgi:hypothetical protein
MRAVVGHFIQRMPSASCYCSRRGTPQQRQQRRQQWHHMITQTVKAAMAALDTVDGCRPLFHSYTRRMSTAVIADIYRLSDQIRRQRRGMRQRMPPRFKMVACVSTHRRPF